MGILNNNQENNGSKSLARGGFMFTPKPRSGLAVGDKIEFFKNGQTETFTVEAYEGGKFKRDVEVGFHAVADLKAITDKMSANMQNKMMQSQMMQNDLQANSISSHKVNNLVK